MNQQNSNQIQQSHRKSSMAQRALIGGLIALALIILFLAGTGEGDPSWGKYWKVRPLAVVTFAGAFGGAIFSFLENLHVKNKGQKIGLIIAGVLIYVFGLWMGTVLGLNGTLWD